MLGEYLISIFCCCKHHKNIWKSKQLSHGFQRMLVAQSCPTLWDPMDCSLPGSSVHRIFQARILKWVAIPFSKISSWPRDRTQVSCIAGRFFTIWATREALSNSYYHFKILPFNLFLLCIHNVYIFPSIHMLCIL